MSKRLKYLADIRPEAATAYFEFLKQSGQHLDDKTRFLISVVTKVATGTTAGLKQYLPHAMRAGANANEIIDAILMSFPAAGLPKVLDALDVVQELNLEDFKPENLKKPYEWYEVCDMSVLEDGQITEFEIEGLEMLVVRQGEGVTVFDRRCPHLGKKLPCENVDGNLTCKAHQWVFDAVSGECKEKGTRAIHTYKSKVENGKVMANLLIFTKD